jgi:transcriptional regulator with XRE-family HTH domain
MNDVRPIISKNLANLRKQKGLTQAELAEKLNYSDKAVSRWEHGDTLPDVNVLCDLCDFYGITLNDLINEECRLDKGKKERKEITSYKIWRCILSSAIIWLLATLVFSYDLAATKDVEMWIVFIWAIPVSCILFAWLGRTFMNHIAQLVMSSCIMWSIIVSVYLSMLVLFKANLWQLFLIGAPIELIIFLTYKMRRIIKTDKVI